MSKQKTGVSQIGCYWYEPHTGEAGPLRDGDVIWQGSMKLIDAEKMYPIFDVLPRLWAEGYSISEQEGRWWLWDKQGEGVTNGFTFRDLCVNIVLAGL